MMHYGFCRKHADQTGEGGCPECAMDHQQATISAMTETAKESSRVHVELHNQNVALQAEVARLGDIVQRQTRQIEDQIQDIADRDTEVARLRNDLLAYGHHLESCKMLCLAKTDGWKYAKLHGCSCGFDTAKEK